MKEWQLIGCLKLTAILLVLPSLPCRAVPVPCLVLSCFALSGLSVVVVVLSRVMLFCFVFCIVLGLVLFCCLVLSLALSCVEDGTKKCRTQAQCGSELAQVTRHGGGRTRSACLSLSVYVSYLDFVFVSCVVLRCLVLSGLGE